MKYTRLQSLIWTPRSIFVVVLLCFIAISQAAEVDPRFDSGSASLAIRWQGVKGSLPHEKIPDNAAAIKDTNAWSMNYAISIGKVVGPGFAIAILSLLGGIIYGLFKLVRMCLCGCKGKDEESKTKSYTWTQQWVPTIVYAVCWIFLLTGMIFGILNNPRFSEGVNDMGDSVISVGTNAVDLGNGLLDAVDEIVGLVPTTIDGLKYQVSGVEPLAQSVVQLSTDVNSTSTQVSDITTEVAKIDAGNTSVVSKLYNDLAAINNQSQRTISQMSDLTYQIANKLRNTLNSTLSNLDVRQDEINDTVDGLRETAKGIIDQAADLVDKVISYINDGKSYDKSRGTAVMALFAVVIVVTFVIFAGYIIKIKAIFSVVAAFSFVFLFLLWFSGSIHFLLGMALYDGCPVIDVAVQGLLPQDSKPAAVLQGCLYGGETVLQSMNITAYNLSDVFNYRSEFEDFASFSENFNFSSVDSYFDSIQGLYSYNLTAVAVNMTVASFGWNESVIYDALKVLNNATYPDQFDLNNYTSANPSNYSAPKNQTVYDSQGVITNLLALNQTIYNKTAVAQQQLIAAQQDIDNLLADMTQFQARYDDIKAEVAVLQTKNISNCIAILDNLQSNITGFFEKGNCSFLGETYVEIRTSLCETMQPAIDLLTVAQFLAGLALIPMTILAEILSFRIPYANRVAPCGEDSCDEETGTGDGDVQLYHTPSKGGNRGYNVALNDSPAPTRKSITATIGGPPTSDSPSSSPDFNDKRRVIASHFAGTTP